MKDACEFLRRNLLIAVNLLYTKIIYYCASFVWEVNEYSQKPQQRVASTMEKVTNGDNSDCRKGWNIWGGKEGNFYNGDSE